MRLEAASHLKLIGKNEEDLRVISAYCQDSLVKVKDIIFLKKNKTFVMLISRFMWEDFEKGAFRKNKRIRSAIKFEDVLKVKSKKINQKTKNKLLECLAIKCDHLSNKNSKINIFFAGGSIITLVSEFIEVSLNDLGKPWNVKHFPKHKI